MFIKINIQCKFRILFLSPLFISKGKTQEAKQPLSAFGGQSTWTTAPFTAW